MADIFLKDELCDNCGAEKRLNAVFCYNCGSQVGEDEFAEAESSVSNAWFKDSITDVKATEASIVVPEILPKKAPAKVKVKETNKLKEAIKVELEKTAVEEKKSADSKITDSKIIDKTKKEDLPKLETAATLRQKSKYAPKKTVEVVWEAPKSTPNVWFLIVSIILASLAVAALFAMLYIR
jgi:cobalamin biosynthesis Mg chelatase CobN